MATASTGSGVIRLFRFAGIDVFLHWSWFLVAAYEVQARTSLYSSPLWNALEYLALFAIVTLHEFGHSLACRQVGGRADRIVLWPLGGIAFVNPPPRPGATLWSVAAGPLVNVALLVILSGILVLPAMLEWETVAPDGYALLRTVWFINIGLLIFNLLPIYPLDGGQILQSLLWFALGRGRSLMVTAVIGFIGVAGLVLLAVAARSVWIGILAAFILANCWGGLQRARVLARIDRMPRRAGFACPSCKTPPLRGALWRCSNCRETFDTFETQATCPHCGARYTLTNCLDCGAQHPVSEWVD